MKAFVRDIRIIEPGASFTPAIAANSRSTSDPVLRSFSMAPDRRDATY
jgi:hypothetical protein